MITRGLGDGAAVLLPDGKVLVPGGTIYPRMFESAELYDPDTGSWTATANMNAPHDGVDGHATARWHGARGGAIAQRVFPPISAELYDPASGTWTVTGAMISFGASNTERRRCCSMAPCW